MNDHLVHFNLELPGFRPLVIYALPIEADMSAKNSLATEPSSLQGVKVLVIDNDFDNRKTYTSLLKHVDATVTTVGSVKEAIEALNWLKPNILVCETSLLGDEGHTLADKLRSMEVDTGKHIPAIATTALPQRTLT